MLEKFNFRCFITATLLTFHGVLSSQAAESWGEAVLLNSKPRPELKYTYSINGEDALEQFIELEEEIEGEVFLGQLNYRGMTAPVMTLSNENDNLVFGLELRQSSSEWYLVLKNRQDFESQYVNFIRMTFKTDSDIRDGIVTLEIKNIDDNPPVITGKKCQASSFQLGLTNCDYRMTDADGMISLDSAKFFIIPRTQNEDILFEIILNEFDNTTSEYDYDTNSTEIKIGLSVFKELDYDMERLYVFTIAATDSASNQGRLTAVIEVTK